MVLSQDGATVHEARRLARMELTPFLVLPTELQRVTPTQSGVIFSPTSQLVTVSEANAHQPALHRMLMSDVCRHSNCLQKNVNGNEATSSKISAAFLLRRLGNFLIVTGPCCGQPAL